MNIEHIKSHWRFIHKERAMLKKVSDVAFRIKIRGYYDKIESELRSQLLFMDDNALTVGYKQKRMIEISFRLSALSRITWGSKHFVNTRLRIQALYDAAFWRVSGFPECGLRILVNTLRFMSRI